MENLRKNLWLPVPNTGLIEKTKVGLHNELQRLQGSQPQSCGSAPLGCSNAWISCRAATHSITTALCRCNLFRGHLLPLFTNSTETASGTHHGQSSTGYPMISTTRATLPPRHPKTPQQPPTQNARERLFFAKFLILWKKINCILKNWPLVLTLRDFPPRHI